MENKKILIVDDDSDWAMTVSELLTRFFGVTPKQKYDGQQALDLLDSEHFDIVITDTNMPWVNGIELLSAIKKKHPEVKVIVFFDKLKGSDITRPDVVEMGAAAVLKKEDALLLLPEVLRRI